MSVGRGPGEEESERSSAYDAIGFGMTFAASALLFFAAGVWADGKLGTSPLLAFAGLILGAAAGFWWLYARLTESTDASDHDSGSSDARRSG